MNDAPARVFPKSARALSSKTIGVITGSSLIAQRAALARALQAQIDQKFGGNLSEAAEFVQLSQPTLHRYTHPASAVSGPITGRPGSRGMSTKVAAKLAALLPRSERRNLYHSPESAYAFFLYIQWLGETLDRAGLAGLKHENLARPESPEGLWQGRASEFKTLLIRVRNEAPLVRDRIAAAALRLTRVDRQTRSALSALGIPLERVPAQPRTNKKDPIARPTNGVIPSRFMLALYRMFEPLLDAAASGWIELRSSELTKRQFQQFAAASWKRESLLLSRANDAARTTRSQLRIRETDPRILPLKLRAAIRRK